MKIISKHKDFYDYMWVDSDPDLVYVRKEKVCFTRPNANVSYDNHWGDGLDNWMYANKGGYVKVIGYTFGIYPYIYTSPALQIMKGSFSSVTYIFTKNDIEALKIMGRDKKQVKTFFQAIYDSAFEKYENIPDMVLGYPLERNAYNEVMRYCWKEENPDFFLKIHSPVFITYAWELLGKTYGYLEDVKYEKYQENKDKIQECDGIIPTASYVNGTYKYIPRLVTNVCFNQLNYQIHKYWFEDMNDVYSDIENFLMTSKLDPEPKISNDGKIIAHGFDLKTSFRKM